MFYLVIGSYGCWEAEADSHTEWYASLEVAEARYASLRDELESLAETEANIVENSDGLIWTSQEYYYIGLFGFPSSIFIGEYPTHQQLEELSEYLESDGRTIAGFMLMADGATWGEGLIKGNINNAAIAEWVSEKLELP